jgi:hypothetical protein
VGTAWAKLSQRAFNAWLKRVVTALNGLAHDDTEDREQRTANVLDVREAHAAVRLLLDHELAAPGEQPVRPRVPIPSQAPERLNLR